VKAAARAKRRRRAVESVNGMGKVARAEFGNADSLHEYSKANIAAVGAVSVLFSE
jgi:hypothetical protein